MLAFSVLATVGIRAGHAQGEKLACARAAEAGQVQQRRGNLVEALAQFRRCAQASCPPLVAADCVRFAHQTEASLPTLVFSASDAQGRDLIDVTVRIGATVVAQRLDGRALALNPGTYLLHFETAGLPPIETRVVIVEGQKARRVAVVFRKPDAASGGGSGPPLLSWVLGGVGAASLGGFAYFGLSAKAERDDLEATCGVTSTCTDDQVDGFQDKALVADVLLGVGLVSLTAAGAYWALSDDESEAATEPITVGVDLRPSGASLSWQGRF